MQPKWSKGYSRLGLAKFKAGDLAGAMKAYSAGLALDAGNTQIADGLAEVRAARVAPHCGVAARRKLRVVGLLAFQHQSGVAARSCGAAASAAGGSACVGDEHTPRYTTKM